jgi:L-2-hydroxyglutarate oxidase LhgO
MVDNARQETRVDIAIIGAGVVGLAIARELSLHSTKTIAVLERNRTFGQETSSRNSEVIHSGIYYPANMLKTRLCIEGNELLYSFCQQYNIAHQKLGKFIVGSKEEIPAMEKLFHNGQKNGIKVIWTGKEEFQKEEPCLQADEALFVPSAGIIDSHAFMQKLYHAAKANGVLFVFHSEVKAIEPKRDGYLLQTGKETLKAGILINASGLNSDRIASLTGIDILKYGYKIHPCKGEYYRLKKRIPVGHLVYPLPGREYLGIHITPDMDGRLRLGPNAYYVNDLNYHMNDSRCEEFFASARRFIPDLSRDDIIPDFAGIRPKLQAPGEEISDFLIREESDKGFPGLINLIGIESPGLTSSLAIARLVKELL